MESETTLPEGIAIERFVFRCAGALFSEMEFFIGVDAVLAVDTFSNSSNLSNAAWNKNYRGTI